MRIGIVRTPFAFAFALTTESDESEVFVNFAISIENDVRLLEFESHPFDNETKKADASIALNSTLRTGVLILVSKEKFRVNGALCAYTVQFIPISLIKPTIASCPLGTVAYAGY